MLLYNLITLSLCQLQYFWKTTSWFGRVWHLWTWWWRVPLFWLYYTSFWIPRAVPCRLKKLTKSSFKQADQVMILCYYIQFALIFNDQENVLYNHRPQLSHQYINLNVIVKSLCCIHIQVSEFCSRTLISTSCGLLQFLYPCGYSSQLSGEYSRTQIGATTYKYIPMGSHLFLGQEKQWPNSPVRKQCPIIMLTQSQRSQVIKDSVLITYRRALVTLHLDELAHCKIHQFNQSENRTNQSVLHYL